MMTREEGKKLRAALEAGTATAEQQLETSKMVAAAGKCILFLEDALDQIVRGADECDLDNFGDMYSTIKAIKAVAEYGLSRRDKAKAMEKTH